MHHNQSKTKSPLSPLCQSLKIFWLHQQSLENRAKIIAKFKKRPMITDKPQLQGDRLTPYMLNSASNFDLMTASLAHRRAKELEKAKRDRQTIAKAVRYGIFCKPDDDLAALADDISEYEALLRHAEELAIDWDERAYHRMEELVEAIRIAESDPDHRLEDETIQWRRDYYASIAL